MRINRFFVTVWCLIIIFNGQIVKAESVKERLKKAKEHDEVQELNVKEIQPSSVKPLPTEKKDTSKPLQKPTNKEKIDKTFEKRERQHQEKLQHLEKIKARNALEDSQRKEEIRAIVENPDITSEDLIRRMEEIKAQYDQTIIDRYDEQVELFKKNEVIPANESK